MPNTPHPREVIDKLEGKLEILLSKYLDALQQIAVLEAENQRLQQHIEELQEEQKNFQNQSKVNKLADTLASGGASSAELKALIDDYLLEIDHCIAFLNKQL